MYSNELIGESSFTAIDGRVLALQYYLTSNVSSELQKEIYGLRIVLRDDSTKEEETLNGLGESKEYVKDIGEIMLRNIVTPISAVYVADDLLSTAY